MPFHVYVLSNRTRVLYTGVTSDSKARVFEHKAHSVAGFTARYNVDRLVYFEAYDEPVVAIEREKQIKMLNRAKKIALIERGNPEWVDLVDGL